MIEFELELLRQNHDWQRVLEAYAAHQQQPKQSDAEVVGGWSERIGRVDGVPAERLPRVHGKLIALGLLKFQLEGRTSGVRYQLSREGWQAIEGFASKQHKTEADRPSYLARSA